jgi:N4-gp56 family major capsid protein
MRSITELQAASLAAGDEISSADVANFTPEQWGGEIENKAMPLRKFREYVIVNDDLTRIPGNSIKLPKQVIIDYETYGAADLSELVAVSPNVELEFDYVELTPTEKGLAAAITKSAIENAMVSVMDHTTANMAKVVAHKEDIDISSALVVPMTGQEITYVEADPTSTNTFVSGSWTAAKAGGTQSNLVPTDKLTLDVIVEAGDVIMEEQGFEADVLFIHPRQKAALMRDEQFLDASKAGSDRALRKGAIGEIFGLEVVVSRNVPTITISDGAAGTAKGYQAILMDSSAAGALAIKRTPIVETKYEPLERKHYAVVTSLYQAKRLNAGAVIAINTA